ncbi:hypothetical protein PAMP_000182 [Pampus punctatissimus]
MSLVFESKVPCTFPANRLPACAPAHSPVPQVSACRSKIWLCRLSVYIFTMFVIVWCIVERDKDVISKQQELAVHFTEGWVGRTDWVLLLAGDSLGGQFVYKAGERMPTDNLYIFILDNIQQRDKQNSIDSQYNGEN